VEQMEEDGRSVHKWNMVLFVVASGSCITGARLEETYLLA